MTGGCLDIIDFAPLRSAWLRFATRLSASRLNATYFHLSIIQRRALRRYASHCDSTQLNDYICLFAVPRSASPLTAARCYSPHLGATQRFIVCQLSHRSAAPRIALPCCASRLNATSTTNGGSRPQTLLLLTGSPPAARLDGKASWQAKQQQHSTGTDTMRTVQIEMESVTPYSQSKQHEVPKLPKETSDDYETRTWREKCSYFEDGQVYIPAMALKQAMDAASKKLGLQIPGKGKSTYTKFFLADVICDADVPLGVTKDEVAMYRGSMNVDGIRGSGKRVWRCFPVIPQWRAVGSFTIMDDTVTRDVFEQTFRMAGASIGIGRFRPEKGGLNGRFRGIKFEWA